MDEKGRSFVMRRVFLEAHNSITSLGWTTAETVDAILSELSGLCVGDYAHLSETSLPLSLINQETLDERKKNIAESEKYTRLEQLIILSVTETLSASSVDITDPRTGIILSTTKGNVDLLDESKASAYQADSVQLWKTAQSVQHYFKSPDRPIIVSNACISGVVAFVLAKRFIDSGQYDSVLVIGADELTKFVVSGFQSFKSLSSRSCKPFDAHRDGLSLGEGVASAVVTAKEENISSPKIEIVGGATSNDANHISGPSRTGEGLYRAITKTLKGRSDVDCISAHGTATLYNDDMESKAISRSSLSHVPVTSIKGYIGHTLGAAGVIETLVATEAMKRDMLIKTLGYSTFGVAETIAVSDKTAEKEINSLLKIASGFGGCNAATLFRKHR